jgi:hypothetical protein
LVGERGPAGEKVIYLAYTQYLLHPTPYNPQVIHSIIYSPLTLQYHPSLVLDLYYIANYYNVEHDNDQWSWQDTTNRSGTRPVPPSTM